jgi:hypothetical protein
MPAVTVPDRPSGEPTARTWSPTLTFALTPSVAAASPVLSTRTTARSLAASAPTTRPLADDPSLNVTRIVAASEMTWLLVRT